MPRFLEFRHYDASLDGEAVRIMLSGDDGREFFKTIPGGIGKEYTERRDEAVRSIARAIYEGRDPGEVKD